MTRTVLRSALWAPFLILIQLFAALAADQSKFSVETLSDEIHSRLGRMVELKFVQDWAAKNGVRVWLFGGTASSIAHYVKWNLEFEDGDDRYSKGRFDYDYASVFRPDQDLDLVIDGTREQARVLQNELSSRYPYAQGSKSAYEVRLLRAAIGDKEALINNPDFINQHSDSGSTGMIELSSSPELSVRDLRDWKAHGVSRFLRDVYDGRVHYYYSPTHAGTKRYREGMNPEIFSVIRLFTKAFMYGLEISDEDMARAKAVISDFAPGRDIKGDYAHYWILKNGKKMVKQALDNEKAFRVLKETGLKEKLSGFDNKFQRRSLAWWLEKKPLPSFKVGEKGGKTAAELGITLVAHDTDSFEAFESITKSPVGRPNVFMSGALPGEHALHGQGFYALKGIEGLWNTGFGISFKVRPDAREGWDFLIAKGDEDIIVFKNRNAFEVLPENLEINPKKFFSLLLSSKTLEKPLTASGYFKKLAQRVERELRQSGLLFEGFDEGLRKLLWGSVPDPEFLKMVMVKLDVEISPTIIFRALKKHPDQRHIDFFKPYLSSHAREVLADAWVESNKDTSEKDFTLLRQAIGRDFSADEIIGAIESVRYSCHGLEILAPLIREVDGRVLTAFFDRMMAIEKTPAYRAYYVLSTLYLSADGPLSRESRKRWWSQIRRLGLSRRDENVISLILREDFPRLGDAKPPWGYYKWVTKYGMYDWQDPDSSFTYRRNILPYCMKLLVSTRVEFERLLWLHD